MKNGGPYTKKQRDERRNKVFKLHFEQGKSAVAISKILEVNRNTINEDIQFWNDRLNENYSKYDYTSWIVKQFQRLESQRGRLFDLLNEDTKNNLAVEDRIYRIDTRLLDFIEKNLKAKEKAEITTKDISEDLVKRVIRFILLENSSAELTISENEIKQYGITFLKCASRKAEILLLKMYEFGLRFYKTEIRPITPHSDHKYNLWDFAKARDYINDIEFERREKYVNHAQRNDMLRKF